jgi:hypothetical protein
MANVNDDICIRITVQNPKGQPLEGTVDLEFQPHDSGETVNVKGQDASKEIDVSGLQRTPIGLYQLTVTPTDVFKPVSQFVTIPASGSVAVTVVIDKGTGGTDGVCIVVTVHNPQGQPLGGTVDLVFTPQKPGNTVTLKAQDTSRDIAVSGLQRSPQGNYQLTVTPTDVAKSATQSVAIPATGFSTVTLVIDKGSGQQSGPNVVQGNLVFDNGLAAAGITVRVFHVSFGGQDVKLGEAVSDAQGKYSITYTPPGPGLPNVQVRVLDSAGKEVTISATKYNAAQSETLNLVVPASTHPLAPEFQRLASDMGRSIGGVGNLGQAQAGQARQDLTLLNQSTNWDARVVALAATAAQHTATTGLGHDVLYALFRVGLPNDPSLLASVPAATVKQALVKANQSGIVNFSDQQITDATTTFENFASTTLLASVAPGAVSKYTDMLSPFVTDPNLQKSFAGLYFSQPQVSADFWTQAATLKIPPATLDNLRLQGRFLYLTYNNAQLAGKLQGDIGSLQNLPLLAEKDYHRPDTWKGVLTTLAGGGSVDALIPSIYTGNTAARLAAYSGDLARKVRMSFPTQVTARMIENKEIVAHPDVPAFLKAASAVGYSLGRTPLNAFLNNSGKNLPPLTKEATQSLKTLHRLFQITPSTESLQAATTAGLTSAFQIASYSKEEFMAKYTTVFPPGEAAWIYGQSQTVSSVTFNFFQMAKQLDTSPPLYGLSGSTADRQNAKKAIVQQFPSMASLFGNLDFCECEDCRSVLSPAAYFVDVLDLLGEHSTPNAALNTPLDVLIGSAKISGRRPDLGVIPLTCENTNTAMPYVDLVNEILEYYIANNNKLDTGLAYDTGSATTADLTAEPQHILPSVYNTTLKQAVYPLNLPFDLWISTVRGFLNYFKTPLSQVVDTLRPTDNLELFTDANAYAYYRAQILAESLGISPAEYAVFTVFDTNKWFTLYGYADEPTAKIALPSAKTLSQLLGLSYQDLTDLMTTGFLNPNLYSLLFQFERFGIDMSDAFSFTGQPGYPPLVDTPPAHDLTDFENLLTRITQQYKTINPASTFDAKTWLNTVLPANYSKKVLVLADPDSGCNFTSTTLQYADGSPATPLDFVKFNLFVRLWKKLGWTLDETDRALQAFFPPNLPAFTDPGFDAAFGSAWKTALVYLAHLDDLNTRLAPALGRVALLPLWVNLATQGESPLYAQLLLTPSVLNNDFAFDDPNGQFPWPAADMPAALGLISAHLPAIQGVLSLTSAEITAILSDAGIAAPAAFTLANLSLCCRYSLLAQCLQLSVADMIALKTMSGLSPFQAITGTPLNVLADDILLDQTLAFVKEVVVVQNSGFTVEDLKYLLRHQFDPVGKYQTDPNAMVALVQTVATGISQIRAQNTVPPVPADMAESLIDQILSGLFPATILKALFTQLTNSQSYTVTAGSGTALNAPDFILAPEITLSFDGVKNIQTLVCKGLLLDWRKADIEALNQNAALNGLLSGLLDNVQLQARTTLDNSIADVLGVWASLVQYEAVATGVTQPQAIADPLGKLAHADPSLSFTYDVSDKLQWLGYRGALTAAKLNALTVINPSATLATLLGQVQQQALPAYNEMTGSLIALGCNLQTYKATQSGIALGGQVDPAVFAAALTQAQRSGTITDPVPLIQISYDSGIQTLLCTGVLTSAMQGQLAALIAAPPPVATLLGTLLQTVRTQALSEFQPLAKDLLAPAINDPDPFVTPFLGATSVKQQKFGKAELVKVFLPLLVQKLSRQLILQTLSATLASDPSLTEALVTDAALLNDPNNPGKSLLQTFLAVGQRGVSAFYYDKNNALLSSEIAVTPDKADPTVSRCHFEGYLQPSTDGPYRFFVELGNAGAYAEFHLDSPDPTVLFANPVIQATAAKDGDEAGQFAQLKGGAAYHFTLDFLSLGASGARMLIQGETLPKGPLSQLVLFPQQTVDSFARAQVLLAKVLQIVQGTALDLREVSYLVSNAAQFSNLKMSSLPTEASDDTVANAQSLFTQFLTLADYGDLRKGPAGGTDGLVDVFGAAATPPGISAIYYPTANETGVPQASGIAATTDTADPTNNKPGTASCRFEGYFLVPTDGAYIFFAELGNAGAQVTLRIDSPHGTAPLANPIVLQHTAAADGEEASQTVTLTSGVAYRLTLDFQNLGAKGASLLVQGDSSLPKGALNKLLLYPVSQLPPWMLLANLTRRDAQVVKDVAAALGPDPHFSNNVGIRRLWQAVQLVQIVRLPVASLTASTAIIDANPPFPDVIAANFKNAVKAQYTADQWRPIAQSVFDPLRQAKRDALVAYLVALPTLGIENSNQLFEYFLVDPGMEPIVQTSRLRLALSSVQTFVQRCLLNLENGNTQHPERNVSASAIRADWWEWMKRYRVWQANREIFLFPENWMEPELRLDKTDLFQALESELLQGDVTRDLVEDAFLTYLKGLDVRARLDIIASYLDQDTTNPGNSTLHVLGRTYGHPHKYFYRTYSTGTWSGWVAVTPDIESNHIVLAVWRGRLNVFWLTFITKQEAPSGGSGGKNINDFGIYDLSSAIEGSNARPQLQIQLHWSEYFQGKWSNRISTDVNKFTPIDVFDGFTPDHDIYIHVSKEIDINGNEGAVKIHLDINLGGGNGIGSFRVTSKNCNPDFGAQYWEEGPGTPYNTFAVDATLGVGQNDSSPLTATFESNISDNLFTGPSGIPQTETILKNGSKFELLTVPNPISPPFSTSSDFWDAGGLVSPFFFHDNSSPNADSGSQFLDQRTYFVQPSLTETVIDYWFGWAIGPSTPTVNWYDPIYLTNIPVVAQVPAAGPIPPNPGDPVYSIFPMQNLADWATSPGVAISYGGVSIGKTGGLLNSGLLAVAGACASGAGGVTALATSGAGRTTTGALTVVGRQGLIQAPSAPRAAAPKPASRQKNS